MILLIALNFIFEGGGKHRAWLHPAGVERVRLAQVDDGEAVGHVRAHVADLRQEFPVLFLILFGNPKFAPGSRTTGSASRCRGPASGGARSRSR